jgi:hypothetical protein
MSTPERRRELRAEAKRRDREREAEKARYAGLSWYEKVEEANDIHDIKRLLHEITERIDGLDL